MTKLFNTPILSILLFFTLTSSVCAKDLYVSPNGSDGNPGTISQPLTTLQGARDKIRSLGLAGKEPINVYFRGGTYELSAPVIFEPQDSGSSNGPIAYQGYGSEMAILSGGRQLTGWHTSTVNRKGVWQTTIPAGLPFPSGISVSRQLFVNGNRATRARNTTIDFNTWTVTPTGYQTNSSLSVQHPEDIEVISQVKWIEYRCGIDHVNGNSIIMKQPCWDNAYRQYQASGGNIHQPTWIENAPEFLDQPGEWYADPRTRIISYIPKSGENITQSSLTIPVLVNLVNINGTTNAVNFLTFKNLIFSYSTSFEASTSEGFTNPAGNTKTVAFRASHVINLTLDHITVVHTGNRGIAVIGNIANQNVSKNIALVNSVFRDLSSSAIETLFTGKDGLVIIANNTITDIGQEYAGAKGIAVGGSENVVIEHNTLANLSYHGIILGHSEPSNNVT